MKIDFVVKRVNFDLRVCVRYRREGVLLVFLGEYVLLYRLKGGYIIFFGVVRVGFGVRISFRVGFR